MKNLIRLMAFIFVLSASITGIDARAEKAHIKADNSAVNVRDQSVVEVTAQDQQTTRSAVETTRMIRTELIKDTTLSVYAKNVKVIVIDDLITLKGPVRNDGERIKIARIASAIAPNYRVENQLQIAK